MAHTILVVYTRFNDAERIRSELLEAGFAVHLEARNDEAGATRGNFTVGNGLEDEDDLLVPADQYNDMFYELNFSVPQEMQAGSYILTVTTSNEEEHDRASRITFSHMN